jgi:flagellar hook-associated protein 1 FlgK
MRAFDRALSAVQNNVANSTTPGFAKQRQLLTAMVFDPSLGFPGGVLPGKVVSYRDTYAEQSVRREQELIGRSSERAANLADIEPLFNVTEGSGLPTALSRLFQAFSVLSVSPNNLSSRQTVLNRAGELAAGFNQTAASLRSSSSNTDQQIRGAVDKINSLVGEIRAINQQRRNNGLTIGAAGPDAQLYTALENLSELVDVTALEQADGTVTVLAGGQVPLVIGEHQYELSTDFSNGPAQILDSEGDDVSGKLQRGRVSALLETRNETIPSYLADLDRLAAAVADRVNGLLADGVDLSGVAPLKNLFVYSGQPSVTLQVNDILPEELAASLSDAPGGNGNALRLAELANSKEVDGFTFTEFYGGMASRVGRELSGAREDELLHADLLAQAQGFRGDIQDVSLDEEAAHLIEFQRAYQASAQFLRVLNELTETVLQMV